MKYACILNELKHSNGRTGMGAVMGSKKLGTAVRGTAKPSLPTQIGWKRSERGWYPATSEPQAICTILEPRRVNFLSKRGILPTRNFRDGSFGVPPTSPARLCGIPYSPIEEPATPVSSPANESEDREPYNVDPAFGGPEYETIGSFGSLCGISDLGAIAKANELCNRYGIDTISCGTTIAFAMEAFEGGLLTKEDTGGVELRFGDAAAMLEMVEMINRRSGIGDLLAEGAAKAARKIGKGAEALAMHVKGLELPMHEPRGKQSLAIGYAVSPTGACHMEAPHDTDFEKEGRAGLEGLEPLGVLRPVPSVDIGPEKVHTFYVGQQVWNLYNCIGMCDFVGTPSGPFTLQMLSDYLSAVTGWNTSIYELIKVGERSQTMARLFNLREGLTSEDDCLPERMFNPLENGALEGTAIDREQWEAAMKSYYEMAGWNPATGAPTRGKLAELGLLWAV